MYARKRCPNCGVVGPMKFSYCEKCKIISPGPKSHGIAVSRRGLLELLLALVGALYSPMKDAFVAARNRIAAPSRPLYAALNSVQIHRNVSATSSPYHGTFIYEVILGPHAPAGQHHGQI
jgi:hypothetical protein